MSNYAKSLARDKDGEPIQNSPAPKKALARYSPDNSSASSVISVTHDTTELEVAAVGGAAVLRWIASTGDSSSVISIAGGTANFDHVIGTGAVRRFVLPIESAGISQSSVVGINRGEGLYQRVAIKSIGVASVLTTEY